PDRRLRQRREERAMQRPRVKTIYPPFPSDDGTIRIGGGDYGRAAEIPDDGQGHGGALLGLLGGARTRGQIVQEMRRRDPTLSAVAGEAAIDELARHGYLEDAAVGPPSDLFSTREVERYRRNFEFFSFFVKVPATGYDVQARLKRSRV